VTAIRELDLALPDGRKLHAYDSEVGDGVLMWHHGTPNIGLPPEPLFATPDRLGIRWIGYDRPGYGGSDSLPRRSVASAATDAVAVADALGVARFAVMGHSGGSPHALACAALVPDCVTGVVAVSTLAPPDAAGLDWFAGMGPTGTAALRAAAAGREAKEAYEAGAAEADPDFVHADWDAIMGGPWGWFGNVVGPALAAGPAALIDDDLAYVTPWGFDPRAIGVPVLLLHGASDRVAPPAHAEWLARAIPGVELRMMPSEGHVSVLNHADDALAWLDSSAAFHGRGS